jgi:VWFA-related protein
MGVRKRTYSNERINNSAMSRIVLTAVLSCVAAGLVAGADEEFVFRSDVSLIRLDAQVVDRSNRPITGLTAEDFVLLENGKPQDIRNFAREEMPIDILMLLDVSGSMQSHVERVASAAREALNVLGPEDRVAIMVFDRGTRVRLPFQKDRRQVEVGLSDVLRQESFDGGTDINRGLQDAIAYVSRAARRDARRAIVILTDDQSERGTDQNAIDRGLSNANIVLSSLIAPDALGTGGWSRGGGGGWPSGGGMGGPLGGIIFGRRGPYGGSRYPSPTVGRPRTQSAGTAEMSRRSGGDSLRVDDAGALENTLTRLRQRYAMHFKLPEGVKPGQEGDIEVQLSAEARRRYPDAQVRFNRVSLRDSDAAPVSSSSDDPVVVSKAPLPASPPGLSSPRRRPGVSDGSGRSDGPITQSQGGWRRADEPGPAGATHEPRAPEVKDRPLPAPDNPPKEGGWRRIKPGEQP